MSTQHISEGERVLVGAFFGRYLYSDQKEEIRKAIRNQASIWRSLPLNDRENAKICLSNVAYLNSFI